ncbi:MAG: 5-(carboxyamino)imidazole ribonucleotide synthase [Spirochaetales bacterium]|jgi:5-(carboxyamino)imidazole ribonucleotide synthase|nr:5-(carboxyamino)imidazole ribonucleotide synthase [Spirochaetales bacterium]
MMLRSLPRTIGIIGGGQLGRMMIYRAKKLGFRFAVLDEEGAPAESLADVFIRGSLKDAQALRRLARAADVLTYEIEHINTGALEELQEAGTLVFPSPASLKIIQDKLLQKQLFVKKGIPTAAFFTEDGFSAGGLSKGKFPLVQKARREGYDGRGVRILRSAADAPLTAASFFEELVDIDRELAVMAARARDGSVAVYPVVEVTFNPEHNICDTVIAPARIDEKTAAQARRVALEVVAALDGVGVFGVELFLDKQGRILVNEVAPRPHNSGHYTMEACLTCQFEQHIRAVAGLPLGDATLLRPAVMRNLLGQPGGAGQPVIEGLYEALGVPGLSLHLYGKAETRPFRKMGHFTVSAATVDEALEKAESLRPTLKIKGIPECEGIRAGEIV